MKGEKKTIACSCLAALVLTRCALYVTMSILPRKSQIVAKYRYSRSTDSISKKYHHQSFQVFMLALNPGLVYARQVHCSELHHQASIGLFFKLMNFLMQLNIKRKIAYLSWQFQRLKGFQIDDTRENDGVKEIISQNRKSETDMDSPVPPKTTFLVDLSNYHYAPHLTGLATFQYCQYCQSVRKSSSGLELS